MKVLATVPVSPSSPYVHKEVVIRAIGVLRDRRHAVTLDFPQRKPYENNLHHIVVDFIKNGYDFWLNIDSDNPPFKNPLDLIAYDKDIIGLPTPIWHFDVDNPKFNERPIYWNAYDYIKEEDGYRESVKKKGLRRVDAIGTGCFIVARRVFLDKEMQKGAFRRKLNEDGTVRRGNDLSFSERATERGFEIYAHYDYPCMHFSLLELTTVFKGFRYLYEK